MFLFSAKIFAQLPAWQNKYFRTKQIVASSKEIKIDSLQIISQSLQIKNSEGKEISKEKFTFNPIDNALVLDSSLVGQNLRLEYYVFPEQKENVVFSKDTSLIVNIHKPKYFFELTKDVKKKNDFFAGLNSSGSLVRGITFGNNQSASVQSSLDLQISGQLSKDVTIKAAISDHNIPIESNGYTQRLEEFDKIYVELATKNSFLRAGHLDLVQKEDYFANFTRKITGLQLGTHIVHKDNSTTDLYTVGSISRGEFTSTKFNGVEGNQGPYKLNGKNGETFIIIISGSEKVYLDGALMTRGENDDYTINYNTGELTFTSKRYISANSRVTVEYIYNTSSYNRFLFYLGGKHQSEKLSFSANYFSEKDNKNSNQDLTDEQKEILQNAGNNTDLMYTEAATATEYDANKILYKKIIIGTDYYYEYSTDQTETLYSLSFSYMGANKGNYKISNATANGRIYEYVAPIDGVKQGTYEPINKLIAPQNLQVLTTNVEYKFNKGRIGGNLAYSNKDQNLFSSQDDGNNSGFATRFFAEKQIDRENWKSTFYTEHTFLQRNFSIIERINNIDFSRDFNLTNEFSNIDQHRLKFVWNNTLYKNWTVNYAVNYINEKNNYDGLKNDLLTQFKGKNTQISSATSYLITNTSELESKYLKYQNAISQKIKKINLSTGFNGESNRKKIKSTELFDNSSFDWRELFVEAGINDSLKSASLRIYTRSDDSVRIGEMKNFTRSYGAIFTSDLIKSAMHNLSFQVHYRNVKFNKNIYDNKEDENFLLGNIKWNRLFLKGGISLNAMYELASGQEAQQEFKYVKVTDGQGIYKWTDYNGDGIEQLDEFEVAEFSDQAKYVRTFTGNVKYINSNKNKLSFSLALFPSRFLTSKWWDRINLQSSFLSAASFYKNNEMAKFDPFASEGILNRTQSFNTSLNFNKITQNKWSGIYRFTQSSLNQYVYSGSESRTSEKHQFQLNYKPWDSWVFSFQNAWSTDKSNSELYSSKRYKIESVLLNPAITYEFMKNISLSAFYKYQDKKNSMGEESLLWNQAGMEFRWNDEKKTSSTASFSYIDNALTGNSYSVVANQMMEGYLTGKNIVWKVYVQRELSKVLTLNIVYDGRKNKDSDAIHTGSVQLRATF